MSRISSDLDGVTFNGGEKSLSSIVSVTFSGIDASALLSLADVRGLSVSAGSACSAGSLERSHVLKAIGLSDEAAGSTLRISFGKYTTEKEIDEAAGILVNCVKEQRSVRLIKIVDNSAVV